MSQSDDSKITWVTCPDCGAKIGIVISVGKTGAVSSSSLGHIEDIPQQIVPTNTPVSQPGTVEEKLAAAGIDVTLVDISEEGNLVAVSPKKFLGDLWSPINDSIRTIGGNWVREGRQSRWEIPRENLS